MKTEMRTVTVERRVNAAPEDVFPYFTDPAKHVVWQGTRANLDPRPGGVYEIEMTSLSRVRGRYVEVDFPTRIVLEWGIEAEPGLPDVVYAVPPASTRVEITFTPERDGTIVRVVHTGLAHDAAAGFTNLGWTGYLDRLVLVAAGEEAGADPFAAYQQPSG